MKNEVKKSDSLKIKPEQIISLASKTAKDCYGVVAIANKEEINLITKIIKKGKKEEGVFCFKNADGTFSVSIYLLLAQDIKITEALRECQKSIRYAVNKKYPGALKKVNVYAIGLR